VPTPTLLPTHVLPTPGTPVTEAIIDIDPNSSDHLIQYLHDFTFTTHLLLILIICLLSFDLFIDMTKRGKMYHDR